MDNENRQFIYPSPLYLAAAAAVFGLAYLITQLSLFSIHPELSTAIAIDLVVTAPLFYYLAIRKTRIPKLTVLTVAGIGVVFGTYLLPSDQQQLFGYLLVYGLPVLELGLFGFIGYKAWKFLSVFREKRKEYADTQALFRALCIDALGDGILSRAVAFEMSVIYHVILKWRKPFLSETLFSYHKSRGTTAVYAVISFLIIAEALVFHIIIARWSLIAAWILTISSLYFVVLIIAQLKASYLRPIQIKDGLLKIRSGLFSDADIPVEKITRLEKLSAPADLPKDIYQAAFLRGFESLNLVLEVDGECHVDGPYGIRRKFKTIAFFADSPEKLMESVKNYDAQ